MHKTFATYVIPFACCAVLSACAGVPASNELRIDTNGDGRFSGVAGSAFSDQEIMEQAARQACGNRPIETFRPSILATAPEVTLFSGTCAPAGSRVLAQTTPEAGHITPTTPRANSAGWDGSTPFVD